MNKSRILIVEDEPIIAMDIKQRLSRLNYDVAAIASSGEAALQLATELSIDLVLMDIQLEGELDGIQTAEKMTKQFNLPTIFLTAHADEVTFAQAKSIHPLGYIIKPFEDSDLKTTIEIALNRWQLELANQQMLERERQLNELKSQFVSVVSHEFRNPLAAIQLTLDRLKDPRQKLTQEERQICIQRAENCIKQMSELLENVLSIREAETHTFTFHPEPLDIQQWCQDFISDINSSHKASAHTIKLEIQGNRALYNLDQKLLRTILSNLISNAIKYSPCHEIITLKLQCQPRQVTLQVIDQGMGISASDQTHLFTPFHRGENVRKIPGTGLGLSIVKQAVEAHGGDISVESQLNSGTKFTVTLN